MIVLYLAVIAPLVVAGTDFHISNVFGSHMVLQHSRSVPVWGWDTAGNEVTITFEGTKYSGTAASDGLWRIELAPMRASLQAYTLEFINSNNEKVSLEDVLFGDVFLCSGQSNMEYTVNNVINGAEEVQAANNYPYIRLTSGPLQGAYSLDSVTKGDYSELGVTDLPWSVASNTTIAQPGQTDWNYFSAVCWFSIRNVFDLLNGTTPIGGVVQAYGGTSIQYWSSPDAIEQCSSVYAPGTDCCGWGGYDSCLYYSQIAPYTIGPTQFKQVLWLQGEQNAGCGGDPQMEYYSCALTALISDWRTKLQQKDLPFGAVLLAPWQTSPGTAPWFSLIRLIQIEASKTLSNMFVISSLDQGDPSTGDVHSPYKQEVGARAARGALVTAYGESDDVSSSSNTAFRGPRAVKATVLAGPQMTAAATTTGVSEVVVVEFDAATLYGFALQYSTEGVECPSAIEVSNCESLAVQLDGDCSWTSAPITRVSVVDSRLLVISVNTTTTAAASASASGTGAVVGVRGHFANWPLVVLRSSVGIPAETFLFEQLGSGSSSSCPSVWDTKTTSTNPFA